MTATRFKHIVLDDEGVAFVAETGMQVIQLVLEQQAYGWSPHELQHQHPYLSLGQVYSALAYYWDHRDEMERQISQWRAEVETIRRSVSPSPQGRLAEGKALK